MHSFAIYAFFIGMCLWQPKNNVVDTYGPPHLKLDEELSDSVLFTLENFSYVKTKLTIKDHQALMRKYDSIANLPPTRRRYKKKERWDLRNTTIENYSSWVYMRTFQYDMQKLCYIIYTTYKAAYVDLEHYYPIRFFYRNVRDYEIGYLIHDIIHIYSNILEMYHSMVWQYELQNTTYTAPPPYMFHIYTNMALLGKHLIHQCNMLAELEKKYKGAISLFNDSTTTPPPDAPDLKKIIDTLDSIKYMKNITIEKHKERQKDRRDKHNELFKKPHKYFINKYLENKRKRKPFKSKWPVKYGWSIEENWKGYSYWSGYFNYSDENEEDHTKPKYL